MIVQILCSGVAGWALFVAVRALLRRDRVAGTIVVIGLCARVGIGVGLFWISYLRMPIASGLQRGNGLWFFAADGEGYLSAAVSLSADGLMAILTAPIEMASVNFVRALAFATLLLGQSAAVALLLNVVFYVLTCLVILWWSRPLPSARRPALMALVALSASPAAILWSTQPLKDTFFQFFVVAFLAAAVGWDRRWADRPIRPIPLIAWVLVMSVALFEIAGVRWYYALAALAAAGVFLLHVSIGTAPRPSIAIPLCVPVLLVLSRAFLGGGGPYVPFQLRTAISTVSGGGPLSSLPALMVDVLESTRSRFIFTGGSTALVSPPPSPNDMLPPASLPAPDPLANPAAADAPAEAANDRPRPVPFGVRGVTVPVPSETSLGLTESSGTLLQRVVPGSMAERFGLRRNDLVTSYNGESVTDVLHLHDLIIGTPPGASFELGVIRDGRRQTLNVKVDEMLARARLPGVAPTLSSRRESASFDREAKASRPAMFSLSRWTPGLTATFIPTLIQRLLGMGTVAGGRGLLWFTDIDTLFFDLVLAAGLGVTLARWSSFRSASFVMALLLTMAICVPLIYTVTNFGTLFRLRGMVLTTAALLPLAAVSRRTTLPPSSRPLTSA